MLYVHMEKSPALVNKLLTAGLITTTVLKDGSFIIETKEEDAKKCQEVMGNYRLL